MGGTRGRRVYRWTRRTTLDSDPPIYNSMVVEALTRTFAAVADPTRRAILARLADGPAAVGELARPFRMSQQAVSKHLALLEDAGLIVKHKVGRRSVCALDARPLEQVADWAEGYRRQWESAFRRLDLLLDELKAPPPAARRGKDPPPSRASPRTRPRRKH